MSKDKTRKKEQRKRKLKKYDTRRKNSKYLIILFWLGRGRFLYLIHIITLQNHPRLLPLLYKFIVWACWAWIQSGFGVQAKTGLYNFIYIYIYIPVKQFTIPLWSIYHTVGILSLQPNQLANLYTNCRTIKLLVRLIVIQAQLILSLLLN